MNKLPYRTPEVRDLGSVAEMTGQTFNKVGSASDSFTAVTNGVIIGSLTPT